MIEVETFEINEVVEEVVSDADSLALIDKMGLEGQQSLKSEDGMNLCPYQQVNKEQEFIITSLCPSKYTVKEYSRGQIPLRVLQVISHVLESEYFETVFIYDKEDTTIKDPFLIGKRKKGDYDYDYFLLARWGEELESWATLSEKAMEKAKSDCIGFLDGMQVEIDTARANAKKGIFKSNYYSNYSKPSFR